MLKMTNLGEAAALASFVGKAAPQDLTLHLYTNNLVLAENTVVADLVQPTFGGYASSILSGASWTVTMGNPAVATFPDMSFACNISPFTPQTVYGYFVTRDGGTNLMWAEKFPIPQIISATGERIVVSPRLTARDESD